MGLMFRNNISHPHPCLMLGQLTGNKPILQKHSFQWVFLIITIRIKIKELMISTTLLI